jgi:hypothetical protein
MKKIIVMGFIISILLVVLPLGAVSLEELMALAKDQSSTIQTLALRKEQSDITLGINDLTEGLGIQVSSGLTFTELPVFGTEWTLSATPTVVLTLPNEGKTKITISVKSLAKSLESVAWSATPAVDVSHTFSFGGIGDTLTDLNTAKQRLEIDKGYQQGIYTFENSVYGKIQEILGYEKSILSSEREIEKQKQNMANALTLRTTTKESSTYKNWELTLARAENSLFGIVQRYEMSKSQFSQTTGLEWKGLDTIRAANLDYTIMPTGDTSVVIASLDLEIANINLALKEQQDSKSLVINGGLNVSSGSTATTQYNLNTGATLSGNNFSTGANVDLTISNTGTVSPTFTISGLWKNNTSTTADLLTLQQLNNSVTLASIAYQDAMVSYLDSSYQLQNDILNHQLEDQQFEQTMVYNEQLLEQAKDRLLKGLGTQNEVDDAELTLELNAIDQKIYQLKALVLENRVKALQL